MTAFPSLARRLGADTVSKLEAAASRRFSDAEYLLGAGAHVGAVYLFGYVAEAILQAAHWRLLRYRPETEITKRARDRVIARASQLRFMGRTPHNLEGWAKLVVLVRKERGTGFGVPFRYDVVSQAAKIYRHWRPTLPYRVTVPTPAELVSVREGVLWFREHARKLWS